MIKAEGRKKYFEKRSAEEGKDNLDLQELLAIPGA